MQTAVACPKCRYVRQAADTAPAWQCPSCGIAYVKWAAAKQLIVPPRAGEAAPPVALDSSVWLLLAINAVALGIAHWKHWPLTQLMLAYWAQSVAIGLSYVLRILSLEKFSTEGFRMNGQPVDPTPATKRKVAFFFVVHFGMFHVMYLVFLSATQLVATQEPPRFDAWFWLCVLGFALNHLWSYRYNRDLDRQGTPNIGTLMFTPYVRIVPMHLMIVSGAFLGKGLLLFGGLKVVADLVMHLIEHAQLQKARKA
jgi:hypothetical protein